METLISKARRAQCQFETWPQHGIDRLIKNLGLAIFHQAEPLARLALDETRMGLYEDKVVKNKMKASLIWHHLKDKPSVGIIERNGETGITRIAKPVGIVGALTPVTNPTTTPLGNAMMALKGRNAIIIAPHPKAYQTTQETVRILRKAIQETKGPPDLIQILPHPATRAATHALMQLVDVIVATGGSGMVKAAYSSGKPAHGVGPGNVQVILDQGIDLAETSRKILTGRCFDHGIICSCEQSVHFDLLEQSRVLSAFESSGGQIIKKISEIDRLRETLFPGGNMNGDLVGQSIETIGRAAGLEILKHKKALLITGERAPNDPLRKEKMFPVLTLFPYQSLELAIEEALTNLKLEGIGHSCVVHSHSVEFVEKVALALPTCRVIVNQTSPTAAGGSFYNGLTPSTTLGCGSWGNNSLSENLDFHHLLNIQQIAFPREVQSMPASLLEDP